MTFGRLQDQSAIVTGAGRGIGAAIAERFAAEGARVVVADINADTANETVQRIVDRGGRAIAVQADVGRSEEVDRMVETTNAAFGPVDTLVNNAGDVTILKHFLDGDEAWWDHFLTTNLKSQYLCIARVAPQMVEAGHGSIINMSSGGATRAHRGMVAYDASKGGVEGMSRSLALDLGPYGIRVNALVPGLIATNPSHLEPEARARRDATVPLGYGGAPDDMAGPALFLASDDAKYVTGTTLVVDGAVLVQQRSPQVEVFPLSQFPAVGRLHPSA